MKPLRSGMQLSIAALLNTSALPWVFLCGNAYSAPICGAVASNVRAGTPTFNMLFPIIMAWGGLWLRNETLRRLVRLIETGTLGMSIEAYVRGPRSLKLSDLGVGLRDTSDATRLSILFADVFETCRAFISLEVLAAILRISHRCT